MKYVYCLVLSGLVLGLWTVVIGGTDVKKRDDRNSSFSRLRSLNSKECLPLLGQATKERMEFQKALIAQLDESNPKEVTFSIAYLLGLHRMEQSASHLSRYIALEADADEVLHKDFPLWNRYPVAEALVRIGNPSVPVMLKNIEKSQDKNVRVLSAKVILGVEGPQVARLVLERAMQDKPDIVKANFMEAIELIEKSLSPEPKVQGGQEGDRVKRRLPETRSTSTHQAM